MCPLREVPREVPLEVPLVLSCLQLLAGFDRTFYFCWLCCRSSSRRRTSAGKSNFHVAITMVMFFFFLNMRHRNSFSIQKTMVTKYVYSCVYEACMSLNGSSVIRRFKHSNAIEIHNGITFNFYTGLPHMLYVK